MKNVYFAAAALAALSLSFSACSNDNKDPEGACYLKITIFGMQAGMCVEGIEAPFSKSDCDLLEAELKKEGLPGDAKVTPKDSCPSGEQIKCESDDDSIVKTMYYYYGEAFAGFTCDDFED